jgi:hypothetical protein
LLRSSTLYDFVKLKILLTDKVLESAEADLGFEPVLDESLDHTVYLNDVKKQFTVKDVRGSDSKIEISIENVFEAVESS